VNYRFKHSIVPLHLCKEYLTAVKLKTLLLLHIKYWTFSYIGNFTSTKSSTVENAWTGRNVRMMMMMMMMIVDLYSALRRAPLLRYVSRCIVKRSWSKRSDAERWITEMIRQQVPDHRTYHGECPTSEPTATTTWYDQLMASGRSETLTTGNVWCRNAAVDQVLWRHAL